MATEKKTTGFTAEAELKKATDNTYVYQETPADLDPPRFRTIYLQKWALGKNPPQKIAVAISW